MTGLRQWKSDYWWCEGHHRSSKRNENETLLGIHVNSMCILNIEVLWGSQTWVESVKLNPCVPQECVCVCARVSFVSILCSWIQETVKSPRKKTTEHEQKARRDFLDHVFLLVMLEVVVLRSCMLAHLLVPLGTKVVKVFGCSQITRVLMRRHVAELWSLCSCARKMTFAINQFRFKGLFCNVLNSSLLVGIKLREPDQLVSHWNQQTNRTWLHGLEFPDILGMNPLVHQSPPRFLSFNCWLFGRPQRIGRIGWPCVWPCSLSSIGKCTKNL